MRIHGLTATVRRWIACIVMLGALPVLLAATLSIAELGIAQKRSAVRSQLEMRARQLADDIARVDRATTILVDQLRHHPSVAGMNADGQIEVLQLSTRANSHLRAAWIVDREGAILSRYPAGRSQVAGREWMRGIVGGRSVARQPVTAEGRSTIVYGAPIRDEMGITVGAVGVEVELGTLLPGGIQDEQPGAFAVLVDEQHRLLSQQQGAAGWTGELLTAHLATHWPYDAGGSWGESTGADGSPWAVYSRAVPGAPWALLLSVPRGHLDAGAGRYRALAVVISMAGAGLMGLTGLFIGSQVSRPLLALAEVVRRLSAGDWTRRAKFKRNDEIGVLAESINHLAGSTEEQIATVNQTIIQRVGELTGDAEQASAALEAAAIKDEFLANMSHEIRTPLTAILGYTELLLDLPMSDEESRKALQAIQYNGGHLLSILSDVLDMSKMDAGKMLVENIPCQPAQLLNDIVALMKSRAEEKGLRLTLKYRTPIPETIYTDPTRLKQILMNLLGNAVKFTPSGWVRLAVTFIDAGDEPAKMQFEVIDTGIGIAPEQRPNLFKPFSQGDSSVTRQFGGTGLGLAISKRLANLLGGDIVVRSKPSRGSVFTVTVLAGAVGGMRMMDPSRLSQDSVAEVPLSNESQERELAGSRVLLVDDTAENRALIRTMLESSGAEVETAEDARTGQYKAMEAFSSHAPYDVILMDMHMPGANGYDAVRSLRQLGYRSPIIALTGSVMPGDRDRCLAVGCDDYEAKPISRSKLVTLVSQYRPRRRTAGGARGSAA